MQNLVKAILSKITITTVLNLLSFLTTHITKYVYMHATLLYYIQLCDYN